MQDDRFKFAIRPSTLKDEDGLYEVCLKTGDAGRDGTHLYSDPKALGRIFVGPYIHLEPELAYVLEDSIGICGYVLGALDSAKFYRRYQQEWLPRIQKDCAEPTGDPKEWTLTEKIYYEYYHPDIFYPDTFREYPSHLHIDLVERAQGRGLGKRMMDLLLGRLRDLGSKGVHLGMAASNSRAEGFYRKLGFQELARTGAEGQQVLYLGKRL